MRNANYTFWLVAIAATVLVLLPPTAARAARNDSVMIVHLVYKDGGWSIGERGVKVLPCSPPNAGIGRSALDSIARVKGEGGEVVLERRFRNPRVRLYEQSEEAPGEAVLMEEATITLRLPAEEGMKLLEFFDPTEIEGFETAGAATIAEAMAQAEPSLTVDVGAALETFSSEELADEEVPCRELEFKPDQRQ